MGHWQEGRTAWLPSQLPQGPAPGDTETLSKSFTSTLHTELTSLPAESLGRGKRTGGWGINGSRLDKLCLDKTPPSPPPPTCPIPRFMCPVFPTVIKQRKHLTYNSLVLSATPQKQSNVRTPFLSVEMYQDDSQTIHVKRNLRR